LLNGAFAMAILDLISQVHLPSSVNKLPRYIKQIRENGRVIGLVISYVETAF
jgi:hypothetical protein